MKKIVTDINGDERKTFDLMAVSQTIMPLAKRILGKKGFVEIDVISNWDKIVGSELSDYSFPQRIDFKRGEKNNGILYVNVPSGAFALELQLRERIIISKVNAYFGYNAIAQLRIMQNSEMQLPKEEPVQQQQKSLVTNEEENYIKALSDEVENPALQEMLEKLGRSVISNNKSEKKKT